MGHISLFARHFGKSPDQPGPDAIRAYPIYLTTERHPAPSGVIVAVAALRFLYTVTLKKDWRVDHILPLPKKPQTLPVVLSPTEVREFLDRIDTAKHRTILTTCYAAGLRISEAVSLTLPAVDSQRMVLRIEHGQGQKDRYVMLSSTLLALLHDWWRESRSLYWLCPGDRPWEPITTRAVNRACRQARRRCRIPKPITPHSLRQACAIRGDGR